MMTMFRSSLAILALACSVACVDKGQANPPPPPPPPPPAATEYVVAVDMSSSLTPTEREGHEKLLRALVKELSFGDRLVLLPTHAEGIRDASVPRAVSMPIPSGAQPLKREREELELARMTADGYVTTLFKTEPVTGTDLFATLHTAGEQAGQGRAGGHKVLVVLSDMLQCARGGGVCMEHEGGLPDSAWIAARQQRGLIPSLQGVCVAVVGADASKAEGVDVREFWRRYFQSAGADFSPSRYVHNASTPAALRCQI
ncbi:hypothetical protein [Longimicrobium sp.]|uniref:hypothetical protein n=1 Tax=Longimicrobium sp. TaxID=2029185 RepID=UPI003B3BE7DA